MVPWAIAMPDIGPQEWIDTHQINPFPELQVKKRYALTAITELKETIILSISLQGKEKDPDLTLKY